MAIRAALIFHGSPGATPVTIYTAPATGSATVHVAAASNGTGVSQTWALSIVRGGVTHRIVNAGGPGSTIPAADVTVVKVGQVLVNGDVLQAAASDPGVVLRISGVTQDV